MSYMCCRTCPPFSVIPAGVGGDLSGESRMDSPLPTTAGAGSITVGDGRSRGWLLDGLKGDGNGAFFVVAA